MQTSPSVREGPDQPRLTVAQPSDRRVLRRLLVIALVLLVVGLIVFAALSGLAADPMTGT